MMELLKKIGEKVLVGYLYFVCVWVSLAFTFDLFMIYTHFTNEERERQISNEIMWKIDGVYKITQIISGMKDQKKTN
jgi:hypothetical protein